MSADVSSKIDKKMEAKAAELEDQGIKEFEQSIESIDSLGTEQEQVKEQ